MSIDAMKQALEALEMYLRLDTVEDSILLEQVIAPVAIAALRDAIEQAQEPVAWMYDCGNGGRMYAEDDGLDNLPGWIPLYTAPPQRKPLTDEEIERACVPLGAAMLSFTEVARAIEAAHDIKGDA